MNTKKILCICSVILLLAVCLTGCVTEKNPENELPVQTQAPEQNSSETENTVHTTEGNEATTGSAGDEETTVPGISDEDTPAATTKPENPADGNNATEPDDTTEPTDTTEKEEKPNASLTYKEYTAMSAEDQYAFFMSFADPADFFAWQAKAQKEDQEQSGDIVIDGNTNVDFGDIAGGNG